MQTSVLPSVVTLGNFDGVHLGHQAIIRLAVTRARELRLRSVALTFRPHPQAVLRPSEKLQLLTTYEEKAQLLRASGIDEVVELPFTREFAAMGAERFFKEVLEKQLYARAVIVGYDFGFGKDRAGDLEQLGTLCRAQDIELTVVKPVQLEHTHVSSSRIRLTLLGGGVKEAAKLLGREFSYCGAVHKGEGRGRQLGFPTANLIPESPNSGPDHKLMLPFGVYATRTRVGDQLYPSITNLGVRPTFGEVGELPALIETYILDRSLDLYSRIIEVSFVDRIREERRFASIDALRLQIQQDIVSARAVIESIH